MGEVQAKLHDDAPTEELPAAAPATRLVIRVELPSDEGQEVPAVPQRQGRRVGAWAIGLLALAALGWAGYRLLSPAPAPAPAPSRPAESRPPVAQEAPLSVPSAPAAAADAEPPATPPAPRDATPLREVLPPVPRSALDTIRGTVRVAMRLTVDEQGAVTAVASEVPGPSRYFERLSLEASRQWRFTPAPGGAREVRLRFHYTRSGVTARAEPVLSSD